MIFSPARLSRTFLRVLVALVLVGVGAVISPAPASADAGGRGFYIPGAFAKVSAGESLTYRAYMDDFTPVPKIFVDPASASVCQITGYDRSTWLLTVHMLKGGTCTIWYEYTTPSVRARSDIPVDPHVRQGVTVEGAPTTVPLGAGQVAFTAYSDGDHGALDVVQAVVPGNGIETCRVTGYNRSTYRVTVALLRGVVCNIRLARNETAVYHASERYFQFNIDDPQSDQSLLWSPVATAPSWADTPVTLDGTATSGLPITYTSTTPNLCTVEGNTLHVVDGVGLLPNLYGYCTVTASQPGNAQWYPAAPLTRTIKLTPRERTQTVTWPYDPYQRLGPAGGDTLVVQASVDSGRSLSYQSLTPHVCTVSGNVVTSSVTYVRDTCRIRATAAGAYGSWESASADIGIPVMASTRPPEFYTNQLVFPQISSREIVAGPFDIEAKGALPVTVYTLSAGVCTVSGRTVTPLTVGTCTLRAIQSQNQYQQAVVKEQSFQIAAGHQNLDFPALADRVATDDPFTLTARTSSGLAVEFASLTQQVCTLSGGSLILHGAGTCTVRAEAGNALWAAVSQDRSFEVTAAPQTLDFPAPADRVATDGPFALAASTSSGVPVRFTSATPGVCAVDGDVVSLLTHGTCTVRAEAGDQVWAPVSAERSFEVTAAPQTLDFPVLADRVATDDPFTLAASTSSGVPVRFTSATPGVCAVDGDVVSLLTHGTCTVRAEAGDQVWAPVSAERSFEVTAAPQTLDFPVLADRVATDDPFTLAASTSSGVPVRFTSATPGVCAVDGDVVSLLTHGTCTVRAEAGDHVWAPVSAERSFEVTAAAQTLDFPAPADRVATDDPFTLAASSASGAPVTFSSLTPQVCTLAGGLVTLHRSGTCTVRSSAAGNDVWAPVSAERSFEVTAAPQTLDFPAPADRVATDDPFTLAASTSSGVPVTFTSTSPAVCTLTGDRVSLHGAGTCAVRAEAGNDVWAPVSAERSFEVAAAPQTLDFPAPADRVATDDPFTLAASSASGAPVTFSSLTPQVCSLAGGLVTLHRSGTCTVRSSAAGNDVWAPVSQDRSFEVAAGQQILSFSAPADRMLADGPFTLAASTSSGAPVRFTSATPGVCAVNGDVVSLLTHGICTVRAEAGDQVWAHTFEERSFAVSAHDQTIHLGGLVGTALSSRSVTASATSSLGLPVTLTSTTPAVCSVSGVAVALLKAGTCTVRATQDGTSTVRPAPAVTASFPVWGTPAAPKTGRLTQIVTVLGQGESDLRVVASTPACRVSGGRLVFVSPGVCRVRVMGAGSRVVRVVVSKVSAAYAATSASHLARAGKLSFAKGSATLSPRAKSSLRVQARSLRGAKLVVVYGNRSAGESSALAGARARAVVSYLRAHGVKVTIAKVGLTAKKAAGPGRAADLFALR
ncbi:hypothetical protein [Nocardioides sp. cx-173]|uniref:hypothetical protein n=1 Tax=Nocardioides sp. cx-173 TaxID=2898796 RepID=UPI001E3191E0|nr:hypothetical protein [Nocardioides sp. cx-173]MCD4523708.1 hypothetical protein [Nocardioides sp. cx-173]